MDVQQAPTPYDIAVDSHVSVAKHFVAKYDQIMITEDKQIQKNKWLEFWDQFTEFHKYSVVKNESDRVEMFCQLFFVTSEMGKISDSSVLTLNSINGFVAHDSKFKDFKKILDREETYLDIFYETCENIYKVDGQDPETENSIITNDIKDKSLHPYFMDPTNPPKKYKPIYEMYKLNLLGNWSSSELMDLIKIDMQNYQNLHPIAKYKIKKTVSWIVIGDGYVSEKLTFSAPKKYKDAYHRILFAFVNNLETSVHQVFYSIVLDVVTKFDVNEKIKFLNDLSNNDFVKSKIAWCQHHLSDTEPRVIHDITMFILEGIGFQPQFNVILSIKDLKRGLPGTVMGTKLVLRDENNHQLNWMTDFRFKKIKPPESVVQKMMHDFLQIEFEYIEKLEQEMMDDPSIKNVNNKDYEYPRSLVSLTPEKQKKSLMFQANVSLQILGYGILYSNIRVQPLDFLEENAMAKISQFFETRSATYYETSEKEFFEWLEHVRPKYLQDEGSLKEEITKNLRS